MQRTCFFNVQFAVQFGFSILPMHPYLSICFFFFYSIKKKKKKSSSTLAVTKGGWYKTPRFQKVAPARSGKWKFEVTPMPNVMRFCRGFLSIGIPACLLRVILGPIPQKYTMLIVNIAFGKETSKQWPIKLSCITHTYAPRLGTTTIEYRLSLSLDRSGHFHHMCGRGKSAILYYQSRQQYWQYAYINYQCCPFSRVVITWLNSS